MKTVFLSDTHGLHRRMKHPPPECDLLVAVGDVTGYGSREELVDFVQWMRKFTNDGIIVAGNHDLCFERYPKKCRDICNGYNIQYLEDESTVIGDTVFYGSPWTPGFGNWHFMYPRDSDRAEDTWRYIPIGVDVLLTHGPRWGVLDFVNPKTVRYSHQGCNVLRRHVEARVEPRYHIFGHIHEAYGAIKDRHNNMDSYNVSICDGSYNPIRKPLVLEL